MTGRLQSLLLVTLASLFLAAAGPVGLRATVMPAAHAAEQSREYLIKAAFLYNFAKFTEWPDAAFDGQAAPIQVCVLGQDPFGHSLQSIEGKVIRGREVTVLRIANPKVAVNCHVLFISESEQNRLAAILEVLGDRPVLTIADMPDFARTGGIINLKTLKEKVRFEINVGTARRAGLKLSAKLLSLAQIAPARN
jgi:hypothetical protein